MFSVKDLLKEVWISLPPITLRGMLLALLVLAIDTFDSFGLDQQADEQAARAIGVVQGPVYGLLDGRRGQKAVTVVVIDDASLYGENWSVPLRYEQQGLLAGAIGYYDPAAIFMDFGYSRAHGDDPQTEVRLYSEQLRYLTQGDRTRVMIGEVSGRTQEDDLMLTPLRQVQSVGTQWNSRTWLNYPFQGVARAEAYSGHTPPPPPMAAVALYEAYCARQISLGNPDACVAGWRPPLDGELFVTWGFGASPAARAFAASGDEKCFMPDDGVWTRISRALSQAGGAAVRAAAYEQTGADTTETRCVYSDVITASQLLNPRPETEPLIDSLIRDRVVLVGAAHSYTTDFHNIPHVGRVPGVMIHAMAIDNLITDQDRYTRMPPQLVFDLDAADAVEIVLTIALIMIMWRAQLMAKARDDKAASARILWTGAGICVALIVVLTIVELTFLHWPPLNVFGVAAMAFSVVALLSQHAESLAAGAKTG